MITRYLNRREKQLTDADLPGILRKAANENIEHLDLSGNQFTELHFDVALPHLKVLDISYNQTDIKQVSFSGEFPELLYLYAYRSKIKTVDLGKADFPKLHTLNLKKNQLDGLQDTIITPSLEVLQLKENPLSNIPSGSLEDENSLPAIKAYFEGLKRGGVKNNEVKLILVGNSTAGKSHIAERLIHRENPDFDSIESTHGIAVRQWDIHGFLPEPEELKTLKVFIWDFGGQEYYHHTHSLFFSENALYVLVWAEDTPDRGSYLTKIKQFGDNDPREVEIEHHSIDYWISNIEHYSAKNHRIFFLKNKIDILDQRKGFPVNSERVDEMIKVSALANERNRFQNLEECIISSFRADVDKFSFQIGKFWVFVKESLAKLTRTWLYYEEYQDICRDIHMKYAESISDDEIFELCRYLHQAGNVLFFHDNPQLSNKVYLNPNLLSEYIYAILDYSVIESKGEFKKEDVLLFYKNLLGISDETLQLIQQPDFVDKLLENLKELLGEYIELSKKEKEEVYHLILMQFDTLDKNFLPFDEDGEWLKSYIRLIEKNHSQTQISKEEQLAFQKQNIEKLEHNIESKAIEMIDLMKEFQLIFEITKNGEQLYVAPQYLPKDCPYQEEVERHQKERDLSHSFTLCYPKFLPRSLFLNFIVKYGKLCDSALGRYLYWKSGIVFNYQGKIVYATCDYDARKITIQVEGKDPKAITELFQFFSNKANKHTQVSTDQQAYVSLQLLTKKVADNLQEIDSVGGDQTLAVADFYPLFGKEEHGEIGAESTIPEIEQKIKTIRIFLASSSELKEDRDQFELFIRRLNKHFIPKGINLDVVRWEHFLDAVSHTRKQDDYNQKVAASDIVLCLFFTKVGQYTKEEFKVAYETFKATGKPYTYTFFKDANINTGAITEEIMTLLQFKKELGEMGHFYTSYNSSDNLHNQFRDQFDMLLDEGKL